MYAERIKLFINKDIAAYNTTFDLKVYGRPFSRKRINNKRPALPCSPGVAQNSWKNCNKQILLLDAG